MPMCGLPFFFLSSPPSSPSRAGGSGPMWMGGGCNGCHPSDTTTCSGWAWFQCTVPPTQAPPALPPTLCTKAPPFFFYPPFLALPGLCWTDGWGEDAKGGRPPDTTTCSGYRHGSHMHTPTHSSTTGLATHPPPPPSPPSLTPTPPPPTDRLRPMKGIPPFTLPSLTGELLQDGPHQTSNRLKELPQAYSIHRDWHAHVPPSPHEVACRLLQPLWGRQRPTAQSYSHTDARSPRTARSKNWIIFRKYPTYRLPSSDRWYSVPTKRPEAKQAHALKSSQFLPKICAKTKNLPSTFPVGTVGYSILVRIAELARMAAFRPRCRQSKKEYHG
eukprot:scaffold26660_cov157-Isochrysis_galbana.AAC.1